MRWYATRAGSVCTVRVAGTVTPDGSADTWELLPAGTLPAPLMSGITSQIWPLGAPPAVGAYLVFRVNGSLTLAAPRSVKTVSVGTTITYVTA